MSSTLDINLGENIPLEHDSLSYFYPDNKLCEFLLYEAFENYFK